MAEVKVNCQPHYKCMDSSREGWVMERIAGVVRSILVAADLPNVKGLMFSYEEHEEVETGAVLGSGSTPVQDLAHGRTVSLGSDTPLELVPGFF